jgi:Tol biopolymer transport system component
MNHGKVITAALLTLVPLVLCTCSDSDNGVNPDPGEVPNVIDDLTAGLSDFNSTVITWSAPKGALEYDIRYSTSMIDTSNWASAIQVANEPIPQSQGETEIFQITNLDSDTDYYIVMKFKVDSTEWSPLSNVATCYTSLFDSRNKIVFSSVVEDTPEIFIVDSDGSNLKRLTNNYIGYDMPKWTFDGNSIVVRWNHVGNDKFYILDILTGSEVTIPNGYTMDGGNACSPVGSKIAFYCTELGDDRPDIFTMNFDGSGRTKLTDFGDTAACWEPSWSWDGSKILFPVHYFDRFLYTVGSDGLNLTQLMEDTLGIGYPKYSPDGSKIAFYSGFEGNSEIYIMDVDGSNVVNITNNSAEDEHQGQCWSPDGTKIVFSSNRDGDHEIYVMDIDGANVIQITNNDVRDYFPSWSPVL